MMIKSYRTIVAGSLGLAAIVSAAPALAQTARPSGPLDTFVAAPANGATNLQRSIAGAVQYTCQSLAGQGGLQLAEGPKRDLFMRCNEMAVTATALNTGVASTGRTLGYTNAGQLLGALQQVSGEETAAQGSLSTQVSAGQFANISGRLNALRLGGASSASRGRVAAADDVNPNREIYAANPNAARLGSGASADAQGVDRRLGWFVESSYGFGDHDQTSSEDGFDFDSVSVSTGTDYNFGSAVLGFSVGFDRYNADFDNNTVVSGGDVKVEGISGSVFGAYFGDSISLSGIGTYGSLDSDLTRRAQYTSLNPNCTPLCGASRTFKGSPDGSYVALGLTLSKDFTVGGWDITPSLSGSYRDVDIDGYTESESFSNGGLAIAYDDQSIKSTKSIVGIALSRPVSKSFGVLTPSFRAEWHHEFEDDARTLRARYALENQTDLNANTTDCVSCFAFSSDAAEADFGVAGVGLSATFAQRTQAYVYYEALVGAENLSSNSIAVGIRGSF